MHAQRISALYYSRSKVEVISTAFQVNPDLRVTVLNIMKRYIHFQYADYINLPLAELLIIYVDS